MLLSGDPRCCRSRILWSLTVSSISLQIDSTDGSVEDSGGKSVSKFGCVPSVADP